MNPALPAGGSALDAVTARQGDRLDGVTTFGFAAQWARFGKQLSGTDSVDSSGTDRLDGTLFDLSVWRHFKGGFAAGLTLPIGSIRIKPMGGEAATVAGFGDLAVAGSYTFNAPFGGAYQPRLRLRTTLAMPTGTARRVEDTSPGVPPNLIAIGTGAIGLGADVIVTVPLALEVAARASVGVRAPLTYAETGNLFGVSASGSLGAVYQPKPKVLLSGGMMGVWRDNADSRTVGELVNSGGTMVGAELGVSYLATDRFAFGVSGQVPLYQNVNGTQIAQSFAVVSFVGMSFGASGDDRDKHDHGGGAADGDKHDHDGDKHDHDGGKGHKDPAPPTHEPDVAVLASGGNSFGVGDATVPGKYVAIDYWATWCKPCKTIQAVLVAHAGKHKNFAVRKVEAPSPRSAVAREHLGPDLKLPTVWILDDNGTIVRRLVGVSADELQRELDRLPTAGP